VIQQLGETRKVTWREKSHFRLSTQTESCGARTQSARASVCCCSRPPPLRLFSFSHKTNPVRKSFAWGRAAKWKRRHRIPPVVLTLPRRNSHCRWSGAAADAVAGLATHPPLQPQHTITQLTSQIIYNMIEAKGGFPEV
jgi:hypothetical protein